MFQIRRKNRETGTTIVLVKADEAGLDAGGGPWVTFCEDHGRLANHQTRKVAESWMAQPTGWCEVCNGNEEPDQE